jgi:hypothetical protein
MSASDAIGSTGVTLLLLAFVLNLIGVVGREARAYHLMNAVGAGLAGYASWLIGFLPFVVLEGVWCAAAVAALFPAFSPRSRGN